MPHPKGKLAGMTQLAQTDQDTGLYQSPASTDKLPGSCTKASHTLGHKALASKKSAGTGLACLNASNISHPQCNFSPNVYRAKAIREACRYQPNLHWLMFSGTFAAQGHCIPGQAQEGSFILNKSSNVTSDLFNWFVACAFIKQVLLPKNKH